MVRHGRSASGVDECGTLTEIRGDSINSGHRWPEKRYNSPIVTTVLVLYSIFCLKCIEVPGMCPEPRWIDYPAPRSQADSFAMAGPIRHCLLRAWYDMYPTRPKPTFDIVTYRSKVSRKSTKETVDRRERTRDRLFRENLHNLCTCGIKNRC